MILEKYRHLKTPESILNAIEEVKTEQPKNYRQIDFKEYAHATKQQHFLKDCLKYRNEKGTKSNVIPFQTYFPTFEAMDKYRKEFYFHWRNEAVNGNFIETQLSYIFLFVYELINYGYNSNASFNISMMEQLYTQYVYRYPKLKNYLPNWMADFLLELGETKLASVWASVGENENNEYNELKSYHHNLKNISMNIWWRYINKRSRTPFFVNHKQKIYHIFKELIVFLQNKYEMKDENDGVFEKLFPYQNVMLSRQLYVSAVFDRPVFFDELKVTKRVVSEDYCSFLSELMRLSENVVRNRENEESLLSINHSFLPLEQEEELYHYLEEQEKRSRFTKVGDKSSNELGSLIPQEEEPIKIEFDFERIHSLNEQSEEFQKIYEEKYGEDESEEKVIPVETKEEKTEEKDLSILFSSSNEVEIDEFIEALTNTEKELLTLYKHEDLTIDKASAFLKRKGIMFGTFLIELNEKAEEYLDDVLIEEDGDDLLLTEEFRHILNFL